MKNESLETVSNDFIQRLSVLNIDIVDKVELMLLINNLFASVDEYNLGLMALQKDKQMRLKHSPLKGGK